MCQSSLPSNGLLSPRLMLSNFFSTPRIRVPTQFLYQTSARDLRDDTNSSARSSLSDIKILLQNSSQVLGQISQDTSKLRQEHPRVQSPSSVFEAAADDVASIYSYRSAATSTDFVFDDVVVNSKAYRKALASSRLNPRTGAEADSEQSSETSDGDTVKEVAQDLDGSEQLVPQSFTVKLSSQELSSTILQKQEGASKDFAELVVQHKELYKKYKKVKRHYFQRAAQLEISRERTTELENTLEIEKGLRNSASLELLHANIQVNKLDEN